MAQASQGGGLPTAPSRRSGRASGLLAHCTASRMKLTSWCASSCRDADERNTASVLVSCVVFANRWLTINPPPPSLRRLPRQTHAYFCIKTHHGMFSTSNRMLGPCLGWL